MKTALAQLIAISILLGYALCSEAAVYRCVDHSGHVIFTQDRCGPGQQGEKVNLDGADVDRKSRPQVCKQIEKLADLVFPHIHETDSILDIYAKLGGRAELSAGVTAAVNYVFNFRFNPKARRTDVVALTYAKCIDGGFGRITEKELPDWDNMQYARQAAKAKQQTQRQQLKICTQYDDKIRRLRERMEKSKDKSIKLQARVDLEYLEGLRRKKCGSPQETKKQETKKQETKKQETKKQEKDVTVRQPGPDR